MTRRIPFATDGKRSGATAVGCNSRPPDERTVDVDLVELVDAIVAAIDASRTWEIERLLTALEAFGAASIFTAELRLRGTSSDDLDCICREL